MGNNQREMMSEVYLRRLSTNSPQASSHSLSTEYKHREQTERQFCNNVMLKASCLKQG